MKKIYTLLFPCALVGMLTASAQTNPVPFNLASGDYTFTAWDTEEPAGTYPANMAFHFTADPTAVNYNPLANGSQDYNCGYNLSSRPRINGLAENGISMIVTGSAQFNDCISGSATGARYTGAAVLGLNTTGRINIEVTWTGGTLSVSDGGGTTGSGIPRIFAFQLQYRIGTVGDFTNVADGVYITNVVDHSEVINSLLPAACENEPVVQIRWIYQQHSSTQEGAQGTRPKLRLDDITVTSDPDLTIGIDDNIISTLVAYPNPNETGIFSLSQPVSGRVVDLMGRVVVRVKTADVIDLSSEVSGNYFLHTEDGAVIRLMK
jgi:hypothetical protein